MDAEAGDGGQQRTLVMHRRITHVGRKVGADPESESDSEAKKFDEDDGMDIDLDADVYGATIFTLVHDGAEIWSSGDADGLDLKVNLQRLGFTVASLVINYIIQFTLLYNAWLRVVLPSVRHVQNMYKGYHREVFEASGIINMTKWNAWDSDKQDSLCNLPYTNGMFQVYIILCLWWMSIVYEFRKNEKMLRHFMQFASTDDADRMIQRSDDDGNERITRLVCPVRWALYLLISGTKLVISICLLVIGTVWLTASAEFGDLLLNSVALEFIILVDETIYNAMFPPVVKDHLATVKLWLKDEKSADVQKRLLINELRESFIYYVLVLVLVYAYITWGQDLPYVSVLPGYQWDAHCPIHWKRQMTLPCGTFPDGNCFPYGKGFVSCTDSLTGGVNCPQLDSR